MPNRNMHNPRTTLFKFILIRDIRESGQEIKLALLKLVCKGRASSLLV